MRGEVRSLQTPTGKMQINRDLHLFLFDDSQTAKASGKHYRIGRGWNEKESMPQAHPILDLRRSSPSQKDGYNDGEYHYPFSVNE